MFGRGGFCLELEREFLGRRDQVVRIGLARGEGVGVAGLGGESEDLGAERGGAVGGR